MGYEASGRRGMLVRPIRFDAPTRTALSKALRRASPNPAVDKHKDSVECSTPSRPAASEMRGWVVKSRRSQASAKVRYERQDEHHGVLRSALLLRDDDWSDPVTPLPGC